MHRLLFVEADRDVNDLLRIRQSKQRVSQEIVGSSQIVLLENERPPLSKWLFPSDNRNAGTTIGTSRQNLLDFARRQ